MEQKTELAVLQAEHRALLENHRLAVERMAEMMGALETAVAVAMIHGTLRDWGVTVDARLTNKLKQMTEKSDRVALESRPIVDAILLCERKMASGPTGA